MDLRPIGITALFLVGLAAGAAAQEQQRQPVDVNRLPVDIDRIHKQLRQTTVSEERDGLNLRYRIDVYGQAPQIQFFTPEANLLNGPVPFGAPTHNDILRVITPQEYRAPAADFGALFRWLNDKRKGRDR